MESLLTAEEDIIIFVNIYRPGYSKKARFTECAFLDEFEDYLCNLVNKQGIPIISGDFNFHMERPQENCPKQLLQLLAQYGLEQHVPLVLTHDQGGTLDLVITTKAFGNKIGSFNIQESGTSSDHFLVIFDADLKVIPTKTITQFTSYINFNDIDIEKFKSDILDSELCNFDESTSLGEMVNAYNSVLTQLMDTHCPVIRKKMKTKPSPWIDKEIRDLRRSRRAAESKYRKNESDSSRQEYLMKRDEYNKLAATKRCLYYRTSLRKSTGERKTLYIKINRLMGKVAPDLPEHNNPMQLAEDFKDFFGEKINKIRQDISEESKSQRSSNDSHMRKQPFTVLDYATKHINLCNILFWKLIRS